MIKNIKVNHFSMLISLYAITASAELSQANSTLTSSKSYYLDTHHYEKNYTSNNWDDNSNKLYFRIGYGYTKGSKSKSYNNIGHSSSFNIGVGGNLVSNNRLELNFIKLSNLKYRDKLSNALQYKSIDAAIKSETIMLNFYSDQYITAALNPYFGFGVGYTKNKVDFNRNTTIGSLTKSSKQLVSKSAFASQVVIGINLPLHQKVTFDFSYRYSHLGKLPDIPAQISLDNQNKSGSKLKTQEILFSILLKI